MADTRPNYSTPSAVRSVTSYPARRGFKQAVDPALDHVVGVEDAIDIHCHAHEGQQDALGVAKLASKSGMMGILYKTIVGRKDPGHSVNITDSLNLYIISNLQISTRFLCYIIHSWNES